MGFNNFKWLFFLAIPIIAYFTYLNFSKTPISYNNEIRPIFNKNCLACHGGVKKNGNFSLLFREEALYKAKSGKYAIIPYNSTDSELIKRLKSHDLEQRMPKEKEPLTNEEINKIAKWIDEGANWEDHWAYIKPKNQIKIPKIGEEWAKTEIDHFIYEKLESEGLKPSAEAEKADLFRRLNLDLVGLPPTPEETTAFLTDKSENAYEKQVDKLLNQPGFGERWATMWLDLARYADSKGYEKDLDRNIWQYRDWVIKAFNDDLPFDQFTKLQIAGDLLPTINNNPTAFENQLIATAFHRNTMANDEGGTNDEEFRNAAIIDRVATTMEVWQGTTMACVQCHSHPYDPFLHKEFYQLAAFFNNSQDRDLYNDKPFLKTFSKPNELKVRNLVSFIQNKIPTDLTQNSTIKNTSLGIFRDHFLKNLGQYRIEAEHFDSTSRHIELFNGGKTIMQTTEGSFTKYENIDLTGIKAVKYRYQTGTKTSYIEMHLDKVDGPIINKIATVCSETKVNEGWGSWSGYAFSEGQIIPTNGIYDIYLVYKKGTDFWTDLIHLDYFDLRYQQPIINTLPQHLKDSINQLIDIEAITIPIMAERPVHLARKTHLFNRGNWADKGPEVFAKMPNTIPYPKTKNLNRLDMANWLVSENNPLTARVMVNRFWEQIFGLGLVETLEDFGTMGSKPSHPELLDWLATDFQFNQKWSMKKLLKKMVLSATYRQSAIITKELLEKDPKNNLLARGPRVRLSAEQIRDQAIAVCGLMNTEMYGPAVKPPNPTDASWRTQPIENQHRRAIYTYWRRTNPYPSMITFDTPQRNVCTSRRIRTNTPLQALTTLNDTVYYAAAKNIALKISKNKFKNLDEKINYLNEILFQKSIIPSKKEILKKYYADTFSDLKNKKKENAEFMAFTMLANTLMNTDDFLTK